MGRTVITVVRTCVPTHLPVLFGNKICLHYDFHFNLILIFV